MVCVVRMCMCARTYVRAGMCARACMCARAHVYARMWVCVCVDVSASVRARAGVYKVQKLLTANEKLLSMLL